jgi:hypothetical protein
VFGRRGAVARRYVDRMNGERYLADARHGLMHDLDNEKNSCRIDDVVVGGHARPYSRLADARRSRYRGCAWCVIGSMR